MDPKTRSTTQYPSIPLESHNHSSADRTSAKLSNRIPNQVSETPTRFKSPFIKQPEAFSVQEYSHPPSAKHPNTTQ